MPVHSLAHAAQQRLQRLDSAIERLIGVDMRLIYGFGVPMLALCALIVVMMLASSVWMVAAAMVVVLAMLALVLTGFLGMFDEPSNALCEWDLS
jgi:Flp pilus assembly protein TadB